MSGLEHDELGHPTASPALHVQMTAKRRDKIKALGATLPLPDVFGDPEGDVLLVGWGSTWGPSARRYAACSPAGVKAGQLHLRHINPLPHGLETIFKRYRM